MAERNACPEEATVRLFIDGRLPSGAEAEIGRHLELCEACAQRLDELAGGSESVPLLLRRLGRRRPAPEAALRGVIEQLKAQGGRGTGEPAAATNMSLDFLAPPREPGYLGRLDHYDIVSEVGRGGMGVVLKAFDSSLRRVVAIKVLAPHLAGYALSRRRFVREAQAAAAVSHDHVVTIHAVAESAEPPYLVMQFIEGRSLEERLDQAGTLEVTEILRIAMQAGAGLAAAHAQGLVHRDIKPANILLENGVERVKISDFGLARATDELGVTQSGVVAGTPAYMAPEQARGETVDHRADLFSLGSVMYAMCTGRPPFRATTTMGLLKQVCDESPRAIREVNGDIPDWLARIVEKLHAKDPSDRYQSAGELATLLGDHLARLQRHGSSGAEFAGGSGAETAPAAATRTSAPPNGRRWTHGNRRRWTRVAAGLIVLAVGLGVCEAAGWTEFVATVIRVVLPDGTLVVAVEDPGVRVTIDGTGVVISREGLSEVRLRPGAYELVATTAEGELVYSAAISVERGARQVVSVPSVPRRELSERSGVTPGPSEPAAEPPSHAIRASQSVWDDRAARSGEAIRRALAERVTIAVDEQPLVAFAQQLEKDHQIEVVVDAAALAVEGVSHDAPVSVSRREVTVAEVLDAVLGPLGATWAIRHEVLWITSQLAASQAYLETRVYELAQPEAADRVVENMTGTVQPESWSDLGGWGAIGTIGGGLVIRQSREVHDRIAASYADHLKSTRRAVTIGNQLSDRLREALSVQTDIASDATLLKELIRDLASRHDVNIELDERALSQEGVAPDAAVSLQVSNVSLESLLNLMTNLAGCDWVVQGDTIVITGLLAAGESLHKRSYDVRELIARSGMDPGDAMDRLVETIEQTTEPLSWSTVGGDGVILEGIRSGTLDILQTRRVHAEIEAVLVELERFSKETPGK